MGTPLERAKTLFFEHDGSRFYMSRNGVDEEYALLGVPPDLEAQWLAEITAIRLRELNHPGNWRSVLFLWQHGNYAYVGEMIAAEPKGVLWERCAFLEERLNYLTGATRRGRVSPGELDAARRQTLRAADALMRRARSEQSTRRVEAIARRASDMGVASN